MASSMLEFSVERGEEGGVLTCHGPQSWDIKTLTDQEAARSFERLRQNMAAHRQRLRLPPAAPLHLQELRLVRQGLGDRAVRSMVEAFVKGSVLANVLELYKNRLGDASAQALSVLMECSPSPGIHRLHLSHNYFSQVGVGLLLTAAARCQRYPLRGTRGDDASFPLWLRVENQMCPWPVLTGVLPNKQLEKAQHLLDHLGNRLFKGMQEAGTLPTSLSAEGFKMFCIPKPPKDFRRVLDSDGLPDFSYFEYSDSSPCNIRACCHASRYGPLVHLPYFWSQSGTSQKMPEAAELHKHDKGWKKWLPPIPINSRKRALPTIGGGEPAAPVKDRKLQP